MIHKKKLQFIHNGIGFDATVTYEDKPFMSVVKEQCSVYYRVELHKPVELDCGGSFVARPRGFSTYLINFEKYQTRRYFYKENKDIEEEDNQVNVYPLAMEKILYKYFNQERIVYYKKKIERFNKAIDNRYTDAREALQEQKLALRKLMRSGDINSREYQKRYTSIRKKKETIELKIYRVKHNFSRRYFECCELKKRYRAYASEKIERCDDELELKLCSLMNKRGAQ